MKTRLQLYPGAISSFGMGKKIVQEEGFLALYKGLTPFVVHLVSKYCMRFYTNELYRGFLKGEDGKVSKLAGFGAGMGAGVTEAIFIVTPFEVVKTRLQQQKGLDKSMLKYKNPLHCATTILGQEGGRALWKGLVPTMTRQGLNQCFLFGSYDLLKTALWGVERDSAISSAQAMLTGIIAGMIGPIINCTLWMWCSINFYGIGPVDVCKTRLMAQDTKSGQVGRYRGMVHCIVSIYKEEGFRNLYKGLIPRVARVAPGQGITFMTMEFICQQFAP